jgi:hypothetical protein
MRSTGEADARVEQRRPADVDRADQRDADTLAHGLAWLRLVDEGGARAFNARENDPLCSALHHGSLSDERRARALQRCELLVECQGRPPSISASNASVCCSMRAA